VLLLNREFPLPEKSADSAPLRLVKKTGSALHEELFVRNDESDPFQTVVDLLDDSHPALAFIRPISIGRILLERFVFKGVYDDGTFVSFLFRDMKNSASLAFKLSPFGSSSGETSPDEQFSIFPQYVTDLENEAARQLGVMLREIIRRNSGNFGRDRFTATFASLHMFRNEFRLHPCSTCLLGIPRNSNE